MDSLFRCDRCNAKAQAVAQFLAGEILLCGHHWNEHKSVIVETALSYYAEPEFDRELVDVS